MRKNRRSTITLGEINRAMNAFADSLRKDGIPVKAVLEALRSFEKDRGLLVKKGAR